MNPEVFLLIAMTLVMDYPVNQAQPVEQTTEYRWPDSCRGKSYCNVRPDYYPSGEVKELMKHVAMQYRFGNMENREGQDVASCPKINDMEQIFMIIDKNNTIRFVPQTDRFQIFITVEECKRPGNIVSYTPRYINTQSLRRNKIECVQNMVQFNFPVLSHDRSKLVSTAPKDGISLGCLGKVVGVPVGHQ